MHGTIYIDVFILENVVINYILLKFTGIAGNYKIHALRGLTISLLGTLFTSLLFFLPSQNIDNMPVKIFISCVLIYIAYRPTALTDFFKLLGIFYLLSFLLGGAVFGVIFFVNNTATLNKVSLSILIISITAALLTVKFLWEFLQKRMSKEKVIAEIAITIGDKCIETLALIDTGNSLIEPILKRPVIVIEYYCISKILDNDTLEILKNDKVDLHVLYDKVGRLQEEGKQCPRIFMIPFKSIGRENGLIMGIKGDLISIRADKCVYKVEDPIIGIINHSLASCNEYHALINPSVFKNGT